MFRFSGEARLSTRHRVDQQDSPAERGQRLGRRQGRHAEREGREATRQRADGRRAEPEKLRGSRGSADGDERRRDLRVELWCGVHGAHHAQREREGRGVGAADAGGDGLHRTSTVFRPAGTVRSSAFGSWPARIMTPMPVVKPAMTLSGTYLVMPPPRATPIASCSPPHARVMKGSVPRPCVCTASQTSRLIAAAGPVMASVVPPISPPATPATAALTSPTSGGTPLATAMANERGTATQPTVMPAVTSVTTVDGANILRHSGRRVGIPRSRIKPVSGLLPASCLAVADCASVATGLLTAELQRTMRNLATRHARWPREPAWLSLIGIELRLMSYGCPPKLKQGLPRFRAFFFFA